MYLSHGVTSYPGTASPGSLTTGVNTPDSNPVSLSVIPGGSVPLNKLVVTVCLGSGSLYSSCKLTSLPSIKLPKTPAGVVHSGISWPDTVNENVLSATRFTVSSSFSVYTLTVNFDVTFSPTSKGTPWTLATALGTPSIIPVRVH